MRKAGDVCPEFSLPDASGTPVSFPGSQRGRPFVLFFYPKDDTPGCTAEVCAFRDDYRSFADAGAEVFGISSDDAPSHAAFAHRNGLPFRLLSDTGGAVRRAFGVPATLGILPGRATFVIDADGTIVYAFNSQFLPKAHVANALGALRSGRP
jgi:peroxiredoxin Q/BCP